MAIQRLSLTDIQEHIRLLFGEVTAAESKISAAQLVELVNAYGQTLVANLKPKHLPWYRAASTLSCASGSADVYLPTDCATGDHISFWDSTHTRMLDPVSDVYLFHPGLARLPVGPPKAIELLGWASNAGAWQRKARLWPGPPTGTTPSVAIDYWRIPAILPNSTPDTEYPDCDPTFQMLWVYGPTLTVMAPDDPAFQGVKILHDELFRKLEASAV